MASSGKKSQIDKFRETARALESNEDEDKFDAALNAVARHKPDESSPKLKKRPAR
jgi:hypothetical protein